MKSDRRWRTLAINALKAGVRECGYHCAGERVPKHVCVTEHSPGEAIPLFAMAPMGMSEPWIRSPFGVEPNIARFLFASAAILYPVWPFLIAAWRALRNGILNMAGRSPDSHP